MTSFTVLVIVIAPSMVQMHTAPRVVDIVSYLQVCHEKWSPATVLSHIVEAVKRHTTPNLLREKKPDKLVKGPNDTRVTQLAIAS